MGIQGRALSRRRADDPPARAGSLAELQALADALFAFFRRHRVRGANAGAVKQ